MLFIVLELTKGGVLYMHSKVVKSPYIRFLVIILMSQRRHLVICSKQSKLQCGNMLNGNAKEHKEVVECMW